MEYVPASHYQMQQLCCSRNLIYFRCVFNMFSIVNHKILCSWHDATSLFISFSCMKKASVLLDLFPFCNLHRKLCEDRRSLYFGWCERILITFCIQSCEFSMLNLVVKCFFFSCELMKWWKVNESMNQCGMIFVNIMWAKNIAFTTHVCNY